MIQSQIDVPKELLDRFDAVAASWPEYVAHARADSIVFALLGAVLLFGGIALAATWKKWPLDCCGIPLVVGIFGIVAGVVVILSHIADIMYPTAAAINSLIPR